MEMSKLEKVIRGLRDIDIFIAGRLEHEKAKNFLRTIDETITLLKEQDDMGKELGDAVELIHKKNERIEKLNRFVNGFSRDAMPVVRCKECKHGEKANDVYLCGKLRGFGLAHEPNWFCADGERR